MKDEIRENTTVFVATDHQGKPFFKNLQDHYDLVFLKDFKHELEGVNTNCEYTFFGTINLVFYTKIVSLTLISYVVDFGMIDQLVASRGRVFFGCYHSTFSGFIFRMRGYHAQKDKTEGWEHGVLRNSYYYSGANEKLLYEKYYPLRAPYYSREFPTSWRDIDKGIEELSISK